MNNPDYLKAGFFMPAKIPLALFALVLLNHSAQAQNAGGIFPPVVNEGHRAAQYRATFDTDNSRFVQRLHYEAARDGQTMWRIVAQTRKTAQSDADFDFVQGEWFWQISPDDAPWQHGLRFDARVRGDGRPGLLGLHWMSQFALTPQWTGRFIVLTAADVGDGAADGVFLQTRGFAQYRYSPSTNVGVEFYNSYGSTKDIQDFDDQRHQIGPYVTHNFAEGWQLFAGALVGLTDATPDQELRIWFTKFF